MVSIAVTDERTENLDVIHDVWFGDEGTGDGPYDFTPTPRGAVLSAYFLHDSGGALWQAVTQAKMDWLRDGFDEEVWDHLSERLMDNSDPLSVESHMMAMHDALVAEVTKRPFMSSNGSSKPRSRNTGAAARKQKGETSGD